MKSYLPLKYQITLFFTLLFLWFLAVPLLIPALLVLGIVFLFRKKSIVLRENVSGALAPISGKVRAVVQQDGCTDIEVVMPWWSGMGIHLPFYAELKSKTEKGGKAFLRYGLGGDSIERPGTLLLLEEVGAFKQWELFFGECSWGGRAQIMISSGDRGLQGASIGYFKWGGVVRIRFPSADYELLLRRGDSIVVGKTLIALKS